MANEFHYCISFDIVHPTLDPAFITQELGGLQPTRKVMAGDERRGRDGKLLVPGRKAAFSVWSTNLHDEARLYSGTKPLSTLIIEFLAKLESHAEFLSRIRQEGKVALNIGWFSDTNYSAEILSAEAMKKCGDLGIDIELNCYWNGNVEE